MRSCSAGGEREEYYFLEDGYLEVLPDRVLIMAQRGDRSDAIDLAEAEGQLRSAEEALTRASGSSEQETAELEGAVAVAAARLEAAQLQRRRARD